MIEELKTEVDSKFPGKSFLSPEDIAEFLGCSTQVVYNWTRRTDVKRRPPRIIVGKAVRFPKLEFLKWLVQEQLTV